MPSQKNAIRVGVGSLVALVVIALVVALVGWNIVRKPLPQTNGELSIPGLSANVTVIRDSSGVPQIYADTPADLFAAQGFVAAQDRFFEMDLRRHITAGRLSELVGEAGFETDRVIRTMGWRDIAEKELPTLSPQTRQYFQAYANGVNAYIESHSSPTQMSAEYSVLAQRNSDYSVEEWTPVDSLAWLKAMAWDLRGDYDDELTRARLGNLSMAAIKQIYPAYSFAEHGPILSSDEWSPGAAPPASAIPSLLRTDDQSAPSVALTPAGLPTYGKDAGVQKAYAAASAAIGAVPALVGRGDGIGSNSWVINGSLSSTGKPLLANDPHLSVSQPGIWYQSGLHCRNVSAGCPFDVSGFTFSGVPGVVIGHNADVAWGFTNLGPDVTDFYLEKVQGNTTLRDGKWLPMTVREETIKVAGQADRKITVRSTAHGPVLSDALPSVYDAGNRAPVAGQDPAAAPNGGTAESYAVALAWTGLQVSRTADAIIAFNTATDFASFRKGAEFFAVPAQNLLYADTAGHIAYQAPGRVPVRSAAIPGTPPGFWPAPGWDSAYDWKGYVPFEQLPWTLDPAKGYLVAANQAVTQSSTPYLTTEWDYGFRSQRIDDMITAASAKGKITPQQMAAMQMDSTNTFAPELVKALLSIRLDDGFTAQAQDLLRGWDYTQPADDSKAGQSAAYFNAVWSRLLELTFDDELPTASRAGGGSQWMQAMLGLLKTPRSTWWDNKETSNITEGRDEILRQALVAARLDLTRKLGKDTSDWSWGQLHQLTLEHKVLGGDTVPGVVRWLFNDGPHAVPGGSAIVNANAWDAGEGFAVTAGPSMRMVINLAAFDQSLWINQTGQSGHATSEHYDDQVDDWIEGRMRAWLFTQDAVTDDADDTLTLRPGRTS